LSVSPIVLDALKPDYQPLLNAPLSAANQWYQLQPDGHQALRYFLGDNDCAPIMLMQAPAVFDKHAILESMIGQIDVSSHARCDLIYAYNPNNPLKPVCLSLKAGTAQYFCATLAKLVVNAKDDSLSVQLTAQLLTGQDDTQRLKNYLELFVEALRSDIEISDTTLVSVLSSHNDEDELPVVIAENIDSTTLFGQIAYQTEQGTVSSNQHLLTPGLLHQANNGLLVLDIDELLDNPSLWFGVKQAVIAGQFDWRRFQNPASPGFFVPESSPLNVKVLLWGDRYAISDFSQIDPCLGRQLAIASELKGEVRAHAATLPAYLNLLLHSLGENAPQLSLECADFLLREASRHVEHNQFLSMDQTPLLRLVRLAQFYHPGQLTLEALNEADATLKRHIDQQQQLSDQGYIDHQVKIELSGGAIGQINGLSVLESPGLGIAFGEPLRLTATVHLGDGEFTDVERKAELGGNIHAKAMMIIQGFLTQKFAYENHLLLSGTLVFEQSYHEIDGDSASLAGLMAMLSALSECPINQSFATTGAIDQKGNVLAVGGINEKIEGFIRVCNLLDPEGHHSVIIPAANQVQLNLNQAVLDAVTARRLAIYPVDHVDQAVELLFGMPPDDKDTYDSLYGIIFDKAHAIYSQEQGRESSLGKLLRRLFNAKKA
jgi:Lon-like ATP-dependent protease